MKKLCLFLLLLSISFSGAHAQKKIHYRKTVKAGASGKGNIKYGTASFYAKKFNGHKTASGDVYNSKKYTAACNVLPLNTRIKVTNLKNKKSVIVTINDRLHVRSRRLVDLSRNAAIQLGYTGRGLARVKIEVLPDL